MCKAGAVIVGCLILLVAAPIPFLLALRGYAWVDGLGTWYICAACLLLYVLTSTLFSLNKR